MAWLTGWSYRKKLTVDHSKVDSDCSDFPVKVIFDEDNFAFAHALETGNDVRFTASDGETLLKYEREIHEIIDWGKFAGTVDGTYDTYSDANADYLALRFHRLGAMNKYAELDNSIDASSDFVFSFKIYVTGIVMGALPTAGGSGYIGLSADPSDAYNHYLAAGIVYDADTSTKAYISSRFEGGSPNQTTGYKYTDGIELDAETTYIIKLSKTGSTLKVAVCNSSDVELWSDTAVATTTPTLTHLKIRDHSPGYGTPYVTFRLSDFYNGSTEETFYLKAAVYHVKIPTASSTSDTEFYCYYGKSDASDGADGENVWDSNYKMVLHMDSALEDSTANGNDGTNSGSTLGIARDGYYRSFDGSNDQITFSGLNLNGASQASIELYINTIGQTSGYPTILGDYDDWDNAIGFRGGRTTSSDQRYICYWENNNNANANVWIYDTDADFNTWYHVASHFNAGASKALLDGEVIDTGSDGPATLPTLSGSFVMGGPSGTTLPGYFNGHIAEARISTIARSDAWIKATHNSLADTLLTYGAEEALTPTARPRVMVVWA